MLYVEWNNKAVQCLGDEGRYLGLCYFPFPRGTWQKAFSFLTISSIPHPTSPALLLLSHQMCLQMWGLALALLNFWTICLNPLFWKVFGLFYQRNWLTPNQTVRAPCFGGRKDGVLREPMPPEYIYTDQMIVTEMEKYVQVCPMI